MILRYEKARQSDVETLFALNKQIIDQYEDVDSLAYDKVLSWVRRKLESCIGEYTRILVDGALAGFYHLTDEGAYMELDDFYVLDGFRGRGIGTQVLEMLLGKAEKDVMLYVFNQNTGAIRLYERMGFVRSEEVSDTRSIYMKHV